MLPVCAGHVSSTPLGGPAPPLGSGESDVERPVVASGGGTWFEINRKEPLNSSMVACIERRAYCSP
jgi:hypothetical protein